MLCVVPIGGEGPSCRVILPSCKQVLNVSYITHNKFTVMVLFSSDVSERNGTFLDLKIPMVIVCWSFVFFSSQISRIFRIFISLNFVSDLFVVVSHHFLDIKR